MSGNGKRRRYRAAFCVVDGRGVAVRCFPAKPAAFGWIGKHWPGLGQREAAGRVKRLDSRGQADRFFAEQIRIGNSDPEVLALLTYYCGTSTEKGFDLANGRVRGTAVPGENRAGTRA